MTNIQVRNVDPEVKAQAEKIFKQLGVSSSAAIKMFLNQVAMVGKIPFEPQGVDENGFTPEFRAQLDEAIADPETSGPFESAEALVYHLRHASGD